MQIINTLLSQITTECDLLLGLNKMQIINTLLSQIMTECDLLLGLNEMQIIKVTSTSHYH